MVSGIPSGNRVVSPKDSARMRFYLPREYFIMVKVTNILNFKN